MQKRKTDQVSASVKRPSFSQVVSMRRLQNDLSEIHASGRVGQIGRYACVVVMFRIVLDQLVVDPGLLMLMRGSRLMVCP